VCVDYLNTQYPWDAPIKRSLLVLSPGIVEATISLKWGVQETQIPSKPWVSWLFEHPVFGLISVVLMRMPARPVLVLDLTFFRQLNNFLTAIVTAKYWRLKKCYLVWRNSFSNVQAQCYEKCFQPEQHIGGPHKTLGLRVENLWFVICSSNVM
jgi:hypothetical protein